MANNHGFADGNKRTSLLLTVILLEKSGYRLCPVRPDEDINAATEKMILDVVVKSMSFEDVARWFAERIQKI